MNLDKIFFKRLPIRRKLLILIFGAVIPAAAVSGGLSLYFSSGTFLNAAGERYRLDASLMATGLHRILRETEADLQYLGDMSAVHAMRGGGRGEDAAARRRLEDAFVLLARHRPAYYQIRYLSTDGREVIRVNQMDRAVAVVPPARLQDKADRYYFRELRDVTGSGLYVSPMDLNVEHGQVEEPLRPTVRFGRAVELAGRRRGFLVINLHANHLLDHLRHVQLPESASVMLLQNDGTRIAEKSGRGYAEYWDRKAQLEWPGSLTAEIAASLFPEGDGARYDPDGQRIIAHAVIGIPGQPAGRHWILVMMIPKTTILSPIWSMAKISGAVLVVFLVFVGIIGAAAARRLSRPAQELKRASKILSSGAYDISLDVQTNDEMEELAKDFLEMARLLKTRDDLLRQHQEQLEETIRKRTREIAQEKDKLDCVIRGIGAGLALLDHGLRIVWHNNRLAEWFGADLLGKECYRLFGCGESEMSVCKAKSALNDGDTRTQELAVTLPDGRMLVCLNTATPIRDETGAITHVLYLSQDVTEQRMLEQKERLLRDQLERAEKLATLGEFSAGIAHEVGNPLAAIKTTIQAIQDEVPPDHDHHAMLDRVVGEVDRLNQVVRSFLAFARLGDVGREPHDAVLIVRAVLQLMSAEARNNRVRIVEEFAGDLPPVLVDAQQIQQVFLNLTLNAIQAMPEGGELRVEGRRARDGGSAEFVEILVTDTGMGISEEAIPRIFDPFFSTKPGGTGLGLSVAHNLLKNNGGDISVEEARGRGTVFAVRLPAADMPDTPSEETRRETHAVPDSGY